MATGAEAVRAKLQQHASRVRRLGRRGREVLREEGAASFARKAVAKFGRVLRRYRAMLPALPNLVPPAAPAANVCDAPAADVTPPSADPRVRSPLQQRQRSAALAELCGPGPAVLYVSHRWGGGTERYLREMAAGLIAEGVRVVILRPGAAGGVELESAATGPDPMLTYDLDHEYYTALAAFRRLGLVHVHIHHFLGLPDAFDQLLSDLGLSYDFTVQDYYLLCPRLLMADEAQYCGEPDAAACGRCLQQRGDLAGRAVVGGITAWRDRAHALLSGARRAFVHHADGRERMLRYFPHVDFVVRTPPERLSGQKHAAAPFQPGQRLRVALIGAMQGWKGVACLRECAADAERRALPIDFVVVGDCHDNDDLPKLTNVQITGEYQEDEVFELLESQRCHVALFLTTVPETHSYTLSIALAAGLYTVGFDHGAQGARIVASGRGETLPVGAAAEQINDRLLEIARRLPELPAESSYAPPVYASVSRDYYDLPSLPEAVSPLDPTWPLVSVFTPAYNHAAYVEETILSVLHQDYPRIEHVILDDGSKDHTAAILRQYDACLRWESQANLGEIRTLNKGMRMLHGEFVMILNDDDTIEPDAISAAVEFMRRNPDVLMCYPDFLFIDRQSRRLSIPVARRPFSYLQSVRIWGCLPGPGVLLSRKALELEPDRDVRYEHVGDMEYWLRLGLHGPIARVPQLLASHRTHPTSKQVSDFDRMAQQILELNYEFFERPNLPAEVRQLKRQARSAAWFEAAMHFPRGSLMHIEYHLRSLIYSPLSGLRRLRECGAAGAAGVWALTQMIGALELCAAASRSSRNAFRRALSGLRTAWQHCCTGSQSALCQGGAGSKPAPWQRYDPAHLEDPNPRPEARFTLMSRVLPPSWSGQAVVLGRFLEGIHGGRYCLISPTRYDGSASPDALTDQPAGRWLPAPYYHLPTQLDLDINERRTSLLRASWRIFGEIRRQGRCIEEIARREGCQVLAACSADPFSIPATYWAARRLGRPVVVLMFDDYATQFIEPFRRRLAQWIWKRLARRVDAVVVSNELLADDYRRKFGIESCIIYNPVGTEAYHFARTCAPAMRILSRQQTIRIVFTGTIYQAQRGALRNLLAAIDHVNRPGIELHLYTPISRESLRHQGLDHPCIVYHEHLPAGDITEVQRQADLLFLPLAFDSPYPDVLRTAQPTKLGEYLASGRPTLAHVPADSFVARYFRQHDCGWLVDVDDVTALAAELRQMIQAADGGTGKVRNALHAVVRDFDAATSQRRFLEVIDGLAAGRALPPNDGRQTDGRRADWHVSPTNRPTDPRSRAA